MRTKFETEKEKLTQMLHKKRPADDGTHVKNDFEDWKIFGRFLESREREIIKNADLKWSKINDDIDETISEWINTHFHEGALDTSTYFDDMLECDV